MSDWSVGAVGSANVNAAAFEGSALNMMASILNLDPQFINHFMTQQKELTSPFPLVADLGLTKLQSGGISVTEASVAQTPNSGRSGHSLA